MPLRRLVQLQPASDSAVRPPSWNQLHGAACRMMAEPDGTHTLPGPKPWTARMCPAGVELSWLDDQRDPPPKPQGVVNFGPIAHDVVDVDDEHLSFAGWLDLPVVTTVHMQHVSPATLSLASLVRPDGSRGPKRHLPLPDPAIIYRGLALRWNTFCSPPARIPDERIDGLTDIVAVSAHDISTVVCDLGNGRRPGFIGRVTYTLAGHVNPTDALVFTVLSRYADLAGVGAQTTHGLGAVLVRTGRTTSS